jgi:hypothetical protein
MELARPAIAIHPKRFGRGQMRDLPAPVERRAALSDELKLFATTFAAGFLFVSILIG